jgi:hypothetical protein
MISITRGRQNGFEGRNLTPKQERFCHAIAGGKKRAEAYRLAFQPKAMSQTAIRVEAARLFKTPTIPLRIEALRAPVVQAVQYAMVERLQELKYAGQLDPADAFDEHGRPLSIREMPEHVRRAIAGYEVDPDSFVTKLKFIDKRGAIMDYSKLAGDIPREKGPMLPPRRSQFDLSKLTDEELKEHIRLRKKAMIEPTEGVQTIGHGDS